MSKTYIPANLRLFVFDRAQGCCEYCLIPERMSLASHQIDHVIAEKHGGATIEENLALSCMLCNQAKGSDIASIDPETGNTVRLYHPRQDQWTKHFRFFPETGMIQPLTAIGRVTVQLLQVNRAGSLPVRHILAQANALTIPTP
ncbi:MAG: HNH endonuclease signature motif containing protein [Oculatellaceae cyanobacterium bins.114]|nr:HNH endonuclease signature motif containing protein [Oculatellaceae cyanobacterium bins.114]